MGRTYPLYRTLCSNMAETGLEPVWRYYKDGGAWLCKVEFKKKTVFWLSVWDGFVRVVFYFTEKSLSDLSQLPIDETLVEQLRSVEPIGKLRPMIFELKSSKLLDDLMVVAEYKKKMK